MKKTWDGIKKLINFDNSKTSNLPYLKYDNKKIDDKKNMANTFNDFFTQVGPNLDKDIPNVHRPNSEYHYMKPRVPHSFLISPTNCDEIIEIIGDLDSSKSSGPGSIPISLIKIAKHQLVTGPTKSENF